MAKSDDFAQGALLFAQPCAFVRGVTRLEDLPQGDLPEVAFAGRSNVGKSSLLNALTGRRDLARVSNTPGRTRELNFFILPEAAPQLRLVDLPGYGYARAAKRDVASWTKLTLGYLKSRASLRRVLLLIDARHGLKSTDGPVMDTLDSSAVSYEIVLTKIDKLAPAALGERIAETAATLRKRAAAHPEILATSSTTGAGIAELRSAIAALIDSAGPRYKEPAG